jgi:hypothetical protein
MAITAGKKVARIHAQFADRRRDFTHKLSTRVIRERQTICNDLQRFASSACGCRRWSSIRRFRRFRRWRKRFMMSAGGVRAPVGRHSGLVGAHAHQD